MAKMADVPPEVFLAGRHGIFQKNGQKLVSSDAPPEVHLAGRLWKIWRGKVNHQNSVF